MKITDIFTDINTDMKNTLILCSAFIIGVTSFASEPEFPSEPPVIAIWFEGSRVIEAKLIVAVWDNGTMLWSTNTIYGGTPYFYGKTSVNVSTVLDSFQGNGYLSGEHPKSNFGPSSSFIRMFVSSGTNTLFTGSWHEGFEQNLNLVALPGITSLNGRNREDVLKTTPPEWQQYRAMWTDIRSNVNAMLPQTGDLIDTVQVVRQRGDNPPVITWTK